MGHKYFWCIVHMHKTYYHCSCIVHLYTTVMNGRTAAWTPNGLPSGLLNGLPSALPSELPSGLPNAQPNGLSNGLLRVDHVLRVHHVRTTGKRTSLCNDSGLDDISCTKVLHHLMTVSIQLWHNVKPSRSL